MADNKEALPVLGYRYEFKLDEACPFEFYAGQMPHTVNWIEVALTDHATATAAITQLRAELAEAKRDNWGAQGIRMRDYRIECQRMELRRIQAQLEASRLECERLRVDAELLDWLERAGPTSFGVVIDAPNDGEYYVSPDDTPTGYGKTFRAAIDTARSAASG